MSAETKALSDGYHTFQELYDHRAVLFITLLSRVPYYGWWSRKHEDGTMFDGMVLVGMKTPGGDLSYHLDEKWIEALQAIDIIELPTAPHWDGYTPEDVLARLLDFATANYA